MTPITCSHYDLPFCRQHILPLLHDIAEAITEHKDIEDVMEQVIKTFVGHLEGTEKVLLTIFNRETGTIFVENAWGITEEEKIRGVYRPGEGITGIVVQTGKPVTVPRIAEEPAFLNRTGTGSDEELADRAFICVPVRWGAEIMGTLSIIRPTDTDLRLLQDQQLLTIVAAMIAQAVQLYRSRQEENQQLRAENIRLLDELAEKFKPSKIIGNSRAMQTTLKLM